MRKAARFLLAAAIAIEASAPLFADNHYPRISELTNDDVVYGQLEGDVAAYYEDVLNGRPAPALGIYVYRTRKGDSLYSVAAQVNVPYEAIATANDIERPRDFHVGTRLLIPNCPGLFIPRAPRTELDYLMAAWREKSPATGVDVSLYESSGLTRYYFVPGAQFQPIERAFFLGILFRFPLPHAVVTSEYGMRIDPFTGRLSFHSGIDLAAPWGTDVYAARDGVVQYVGRNRTYGNFVLLKHDDGYQTLYGHLSSVSVRLNDYVPSGMIIGKVGSTGLSTGPHLHFEIRHLGRTEDPAPLLPMGDQ